MPDAALTKACSEQPWRLLHDQWGLPGAGVAAALQRGPGPRARAQCDQSPGARAVAGHWMVPSTTLHTRPPDQTSPCSSTINSMMAS